MGLSFLQHGMVPPPATHRILTYRYPSWLTVVENKSIFIYQYVVSSIAVSQHTITI